MEVRAEYTEALIKTVTRRVYLRLIGWHTFVAVGFGLVYLFFLIASGDRSWLVGALGAVLLVAMVVGIAVYFLLRRRSLAVLRRMTDPSTLFTFTEAGFSAKSDLGSSELKWQVVTKVWTFPEAWLLFLDKGVYVTVPTSSLTMESRELIRRSVCACGGKVA